MSGVLNRGKIYPVGVNFTHPGGKLNDAEVAIFVFSTALVCKQKTGGKFYVRKLARGIREKRGWKPLGWVNLACPYVKAFWK